MKKENISFVGAKGKQLPALLWLPDGEVKLLLYIVHGMTEHMERYDDFARCMTEQGVVVAGFDLRGHGQNEGNANIASFGEGGWQASLEDMHLFYLELQQRFPSVPKLMLGFSLGSFLLRDYLGCYKDPLAGAVIMGSGQQPAFVLSILAAIVKGQIKKSGFDGSTALVKQLSFETYNKKFAPNKSRADWLCADESELNLYCNDPLCREEISSGLFWQLLCAMKRCGQKSSYRNWRKDMPILLLSGQDDPVGDFGKGVKAIEGSMKEAGLQNVQMKLFPAARHALLHEKANGAAEAACRELFSWLERLAV